MRKNQNAELRKPEILEAYYQVIIQEGLEGASIGKIAKRLNIHPSLIIHYFKNKENLKLALIELLTEKYDSFDMIDLSHIEDDEMRYHALMDVVFSFKWSRTVDPGVHFGFYYLSFRSEDIAKRLKVMFKWFRDYLHEQLVYFNRKGIVRVRDEKKAADFIITIMEGLEFHAQFLGNGQPFEEFADAAKHMVKVALRNNTL